jgi:hypothetical protein
VGRNVGRDVRCDVRCDVGRDGLDVGDVQCDVRCDVRRDGLDVGDVSTVPRVLPHLGLLPRTGQNALLKFSLSPSFVLSLLPIHGRVRPSSFFFVPSFPPSFSLSLLLFPSFLPLWAYQSLTALGGSPEVPFTANHFSFLPRICFISSLSSVLRDSLLFSSLLFSYDLLCYQSYCFAVLLC